MTNKNNERDELDDFKNWLRQNPPPAPDEARKKLSISNAIEAFEQKNVASAQGMGAADRPMNKWRKFYALFKGDSTMSTYRSFKFSNARAVMGACCVLIIAAGLLSSPLLQAPLDRIAAEPAIAVATPSPEPEQPIAANPAIQAEPPIAKSEPAPAILQPEQQTVSRIDQSSALPGAPVKQEKKDLAAIAAPAAPVLGKVADETRMAESAKAALSGAGISSYTNSVDTVQYRSSMMPVPSIPPVQDMYYQPPVEGRDKFDKIETNGLKTAVSDPVSTFSIDVDTASYAFMRSSLNNGALPQKDAVRVEELINYFPYNYAAPQSKDEPFKAHVAVYPSPWNKQSKLLHIGIKAYELQQAEKPKSNLVFLIDTSGSMNEPNKLPLLQNSMKLLVSSLKPNDTISIVTYAGSAGTVLPPTKANEKSKILAALDNLSAGGSTAGAEGIRQAYQLAEENFDKDGVNRVILATDGDFNVGIIDQNELKSFIERKRETGVFLSILGFGRGNYNDALMQTLAQNGNGNAAYIDSLSEARKVLVEEAGSTLFSVAKDVKIQVEFNPAAVAEYRLIGYENRLLKREDFNNDKIDAGDIGAGHSVTAIYEIVPAGGKLSSDPLRYQLAESMPSSGAAVRDRNAHNDEYAFVKIRYKLPDSDNSKLITTPVGASNEYQSLREVPPDARFATAVAGFGQLLRGDPYIQSFGYDDAINLAQGAKAGDPFGYRSEFISLMRLAKNLSGAESPQNPQ